MVRDKKDAACFLRSAVNKTEDRPKQGFILVFIFYDDHHAASATIAVFCISYAAHIQVTLRTNSYSRLLLCRYLMMSVDHKYGGIF